MKKGLKGRVKGVVPAAHFCSKCPELAPHVDIEPQPDLKLCLFIQRGNQAWDSRSTTLLNVEFICLLHSDLSNFVIQGLVLDVLPHIVPPPKKG